MGEYSKGCSPVIMSFINWNCYVFGTLWVFQFLKEITLQMKPDFYFCVKLLVRRRRWKSFSEQLVLKAGWLLTLEVTVGDCLTLEA